MLPLLGAIAPAIGGVASALGQHSANRANAAAAQAQMDFQERMSNTAYQRAMKDMQKAGLNPILAGRLGGASSPGGSMPNIQNPLSGAGATGAAVTQAFNNSALTAAQVQQTKAQTNLTNQQAGVINQQYDRGAVLEPLVEILGGLTRNLQPGMEHLIKQGFDMFETYIEQHNNSAKENHRQSTNVVKPEPTKNLPPGAKMEAEKRNELRKKLQYQKNALRFRPPPGIRRKIYDKMHGL